MTRASVKRRFVLFMVSVINVHSLDGVSYSSRSVRGCRATDKQRRETLSALANLARVKPLRFSEPARAAAMKTTDEKNEELSVSCVAEVDSGGFHQVSSFH